MGNGINYEGITVSGVIKKLDEYIDNLVQDGLIIKNAADACDMAMGNDDAIKKYIAKLDDTYVYLAKAISHAQHLKEFLENQNKKIENYYDSI